MTWHGRKAALAEQHQWKSIRAHTIYLKWKSIQLEEAIDCLEHMDHEWTSIQLEAIDRLDHMDHEWTSIHLPDVEYIGHAD